MSKTWLITGVSSGLGQALALEVLRNGDNVVAGFRKAEQAAAFSAEHAGNGLGVVLDITDPAQVRDGAQAAQNKFGRIDVLVNNAGYGAIGAIEEFSVEEIRQLMETNFLGAVMLTKEVLPLMREQGSGHILQISSQSGFRAGAGFGIYNASKFALEGFSEALALEVAPFNIRVVIVEPGPFRTQFLGGSLQLPLSRIEAYQKGPVGQMYQYRDRMNGQQEGDPEKAARVLAAYVYENRTALRLPLGKAAFQAIRSKISSVEKDLAANESLAFNL